MTPLQILLGAAADQLGAPDLQDEIALEELDLGASSHEKGPLRAVEAPETLEIFSLVLPPLPQRANSLRTSIEIQLKSN